MSNTNIAKKAATSFARKNGYDIITYVTSHKNCLVFHASTATLDGTCYGYPIYVLVDTKLHCRYANTDECFEIMSISSRQDKTEKK